jgi:hypothetical protein
MSLFTKEGKSRKIRMKARLQANGPRHVALAISPGKLSYRLA